MQNDGTRWCPVKQQLVGQHDVCDQWTLSESLTHAGIPRGKVKDKAYLAYLLMVRAEESTAIQMKIMTEEDRRSIIDIRAAYEAKFKSVYSIH